MDRVLRRISKSESPSLPTPESGSVLALGVEVHRLTVCLLEPVSGHYRLAAWWTAPSGLQRSVAEQIEDVCERFGKRIQRRLWDPARFAPYTQSIDPVGYPPLQHIAIAASPRPRLRVWVTGLTAHNSLASAIGALEASQTQIVGTTSLHADSDAESLAHDLNATRPEVLILAGGYDSGPPSADSSLAKLTRYLGSALRRLPEGAVPEIVYSGNATAYPEVSATLQAACQCAIGQVDNVLPAPDQAHVQALSQMANELYWRNCQRIRDFTRLEQWVSDSAPMMTVETSFIRLVQLWLQMSDLPELHGVYAGYDRTLHVWADANTGRALVRFITPGTILDNAASWPPVKLVSGTWGDDDKLPDSVLWWDSSGLAPVAAAAARVAPQAAVESLRADLLIRRQG